MILGMGRVMDNENLITVVVPAYNAQETIGDTLLSVRAQSFDNIEILVVDDGSSDSTSAVVQTHADEDSRVRLVQQSNLGVAAARNRGIEEAGGRYIAPIDADDLWRPQKLAKQLAAMEAGGTKVGLVYCWTARIDEFGRVISYRHRPTAAGDVFSTMCQLNLVGNGSAALMRTEAVRKAGGYDPGLRTQNAQGCEDLKLYLQLAEDYEVAVVPEFLTGYRRRSDNMSSDWRQMTRSFDAVAAEFVARRPDVEWEFHRGRLFMLRQYIIRAVKERLWTEALSIFRAIFDEDRVYAASLIVHLPPALISNFLSTGIGEAYIRNTQQIPLASPNKNLAAPSRVRNA